ncbi:hypothetical protein Slash_6 [Bacillus phage Slash]|uniref:Uncharacterized protein n=2 Tax=Slashvirus TaxID=1921709 RepID=U5PXQ2_9CAUD|nr:hypothetical protein Staley_6 [Bacillus phage Staley]YP_008771908.1 hypothetical protein Slash_6 [Bacillus phage Slash]AGY48295.1 hypothetical protein Slash_6 [Bacillus phage Slash]AGY48689.1 hypothetical protein Staley_6 [Bacillus phage Staley]
MLFAIGMLIGIVIGLAVALLMDEWT